MDEYDIKAYYDKALQNYRKYKIEEGNNNDEALYGYENDQIKYIYLSQEHIEINYNIMESLIWMKSKKKNT
jgi:hypothetical protein